MGTLQARLIMLLLLSLGIIGSILYMHHLKNERDDAIADKGRVESDNKILRQSLAAANSQNQALIKGQTTFGKIDQDLFNNQEQANAELEKTIADLRNGNRRLRDRLAVASGRADQVASGTSSCDAGEKSGLSIEDGELLIRFADEADDAVRQLAACQQIVKTDREILELQR